MICSQEKIPQITPKPHVQEFYKKYLANIFYKNGNNPTFINVNGFPVQCDNFYYSLKAVGNVENEVLNAYVQICNYDNECPDPKEKQPSKYCFTSYFTIINMSTLFKSAGWIYKNAQNFECISPENYPQQKKSVGCCLQAGKV
ncbi:uncharacterized protein LOC123430030 [Hordeum vulgare subsp. vulgare]|uniref:uncharacterized protein LOC123430030 n=1 Tax=Hordeum vulgare subsp. vulgare TaxID=112509 RepID=UPI001D1A3A86|nr:uncharacterized protein LOC123430030 [Hordeum vulgare subsp. vulgare]